MNVLVKKLIIIFIIFSIIIILNTKIFASFNPDDYEPSGLSSGDVGVIGTTVGNILATIRNIGIIISVVVLTIIGLKYIISSVDEKANYKENMVPYVIGCFILAGATILPSIIYDMVN